MSELRTKKDYQTALLRLKIQLPPRNCTLRELQELYNNATREEVTPVRSRAAASSTMRQSAPLPLPREVSSRRPKRSLAEGTASPAPNRKRASTPATAHPARTVPPDISPRVSPPPPPPPYPPPPIHPPPSRLNERTSRQSFGNVALNEQQASDNRRTSRRSFGNVPLSQQSPSAVVAPAPQQQPAARRSFGNIPLNQQSLRPRPIDSMEELPSFNFAEDPIPPPAEAEASNFSRLRGLLASLTSSRLLKLAITPVVLVLALAIASMLPTSVLPPTPTHPQLAAPDGAEPPGQMERLAMKLSPSALYQSSAIFSTLAWLWACFLDGLFALLDPANALNLFTWALRSLGSCVYRYPSKMLAVAATVTGLVMLYKAYRYFIVWKEARKAAADQMVDDAALWVVSQLREHHEKWTRASGSGRLMGAADLRRRIPKRILSDQKLWPQVEKRVTSDEAVTSFVSADVLQWGFRKV